MDKEDFDKFPFLSKAWTSQRPLKDLSSHLDQDTPFLFWSLDNLVLALYELVLDNIFYFYFCERMNANFWYLYNLNVGHLYIIVL